MIKFSTIYFFLFYFFYNFFSIVLLGIFFCLYIFKADIWRYLVNIGVILILINKVLMIEESS